MADAAAGGAAAASGAAGGAKEDGGSKRTPSEFLKNVLGRPVVVKLNSGVDYRGPAPRLPGRAPPPQTLSSPHGAKETSFSRVPQGSWRTWTGT